VLSISGDFQALGPLHHVRYANQFGRCLLLGCLGPNPTSCRWRAHAAVHNLLTPTGLMKAVTMPAASVEAATEALARWGVIAHRISPVEGGTINSNFAIDAATSERFFLRCYHLGLATSQIEREHAIVSWVAARAAPAPVPLPTPDAKTVVELGPQQWALFPWIEHQPVQRGRLSTGQAYAMGEAHGRLQAVLTHHPESRDATFAMRWSKEQSLAALDLLLREAREGAMPQIVVEGVELQRASLAALDSLPPEHFASMPCQLLHGDFHDRQVLFRGDVVAAIVDWEMCRPAPRAWELVRSLAFAKILDAPLLEPYLAGYRQHVQLSRDEADLALTLWFQSRLVGFWVWWAAIRDGNEQVQEFFADTVEETRRVTDLNWTGRVRQRFIEHACG
jgi:Ser/Thr protein kinase RdoA (MazF antagonist)